MYCRDAIAAGRGRHQDGGASRHVHFFDQRGIDDDLHDKWIVSAYPSIQKLNGSLALS
jgi:hypothetical protein